MRRNADGRPAPGRRASREPGVPAPLTNDRDENPTATGPLERIAAWILRGPLVVSLVVLCLAQLATWAPHYLTWPWHVDFDVLATLARGWTEGKLPYRDLRCDNFPGAIEQFWIVGHLFGRGATWSFYACDVGLLLAWLGLLLTWSRVRLHAVLPGAVAAAFVLTHYLASDLTCVAQRDWHAPMLALAAIMICELSAGAASIAFAAALTACACAIRPQVVLFLPAIALALAQTRRAAGGGAIAVGRGWLVGVAWLAVDLAALFAPLYLGGIFGDFQRGVGRALYGRPYNHVGLMHIARRLLLQALVARNLLIPIVLVVLYSAGRPGTRALIRTWLPALLGAWFYKPLSPSPYPYLDHPLALANAIGAGLAAAVLVDRLDVSSRVRLAALLCLIGLGVAPRPAYCGLGWTRQGLRDLSAGVMPHRPPAGYVLDYADPATRDRVWTSYRDAIVFLKYRTEPEAEVINLLLEPLAVCAPSERMTAMPFESLFWLLVDAGDETAVERALEDAGPRVRVVWSPDAPPSAIFPNLSAAVVRLTPVVRRNYLLEKNFGDVEIWRRRP